MKISKNKYILSFFVVVGVLALVRCIFPEVAEPVAMPLQQSRDVARNGTVGDGAGMQSLPDTVARQSANINVGMAKHRIYSVPSFHNAFPDNNDVQLVAAERNGVKPVQNRAEAENRMDDLVYIGSDPYYHVDRLRSSIPYLVPKAAVLLRDIGRAYFDSLYIKGIPLNKIIVTSVLRTKDDVKDLRRRNGNATENSCHLYGTTFDICYNRYKTVEDPDGPKRREVRNDTLKWVLSEVLRDFRENGRCLVKYEMKQGCFHITVN